MLILIQFLELSRLDAMTNEELNVKIRVKTIRRIMKKSIIPPSLYHSCEVHINSASQSMGRYSTWVTFWKFVGGLKLTGHV